MSRTVFLPVQPDMNWMEHAKCAGLAAKEGNFDTFFPDHDIPGQNDCTAKAKAICAGCPVKEDCLDYAMYFHIWEGVFGGLSGNQRRLLSRSQRKLRKENARIEREAADWVANRAVGE